MSHTTPTTQSHRFHNHQPALHEPDPLLPRTFTNPGPDNPVPASVFLYHLELDHAPIHDVLQQAYPAYRRNEHLPQKVQARLKFYLWMTLKGHEHIQPAYNELQEDAKAAFRLGFRDGLPAYDTLREFINDRFSADLKRELRRVLLRLTVQHHPSLGDEQAHDATPVPASRWDTACPYNGYREVEMHKLEARWDPEYAALLGLQFYHGTCDEGRWVVPFHERMRDVGVRGGTVTVDGGYTSLRNIAVSWACGFPLRFRCKDHWRVDAQAACEEVRQRYQKHHGGVWFDPDAGVERMARFLVEHGSERDVGAVGRWVRDRFVEGLGEAEGRVLSRVRSRNEGLHGPLKRLPLLPSWRGVGWMRDRVLACGLALVAVQWVRVRGGVREGLCRVAHIV
jgi:hypothetical protein